MCSLNPLCALLSTGTLLLKANFLCGFQSPKKLTRRTIIKQKSTRNSNQNYQSKKKTFHRAAGLVCLID